MLFRPVDGMQVMHPHVLSRVTHICFGMRSMHLLCLIPSLPPSVHAQDASPKLLLPSISSARLHPLPFHRNPSTEPPPQDLPA